MARFKNVVVHLKTVLLNKTVHGVKGPRLDPVCILSGGTHFLM